MVQWRRCLLLQSIIIMTIIFIWRFIFRHHPFAVTLCLCVALIVTKYFPQGFRGKKTRAKVMNATTKGKKLKIKIGPQTTLSPIPPPIYWLLSKFECICINLKCRHKKENRERASEQASESRIDHQYYSVNLIIYGIMDKNSIILSVR